MTSKLIKLGKFSTYDRLIKHPFPSFALQYAMRVTVAIEKELSVFKVEGEYNRLPSKSEHYCISVGTALSHVLTICQQLEHSILYFSAFSPTGKMKKAGISRQTHLLYCIENQIIRTQSMYDRLLRLIDRVFDILNPSHVISHEMIISNLHVKHTDIPNKLKKLRKIIKAYYHDRNVIIHEQQYLEDELRTLEVFTTLSSSPGPYQGQENLIEEIKYMSKEIVKDKTTEFTNVNRAAFEVIGELFTNLFEVYENKRTFNERIYGKPELAPIPNIVIH